MLSFFAPDRKSKKSARANIALRILLVTDSLVVFSAAMLGPIYALFVRDIGGDILDTGLAAGVFTATAGIVVFLSGRFSDQIKENELVVASGYAIMGIGFFSYGIVHSVTELLFVQVLIGFGQALCSPSFDALYSKHVEPGKSGTQWGAWESMNYFAAAFGALAGSGVASLFGFPALFTTMGCLAFTSATYIYFLPRRVL
jgi:sugar phosphate permease